MTVPSLFGDSDDHEGPAALSPSSNRVVELGAPALRPRRRCIASIAPSHSTAMSWSVKSTSSAPCRTPSGSIESLTPTSSAALAAPAKRRRLACSPKRSIACTTIRANAPATPASNCLAINAGASPDIIEIDAASNRGIDDIRDLRERVRYAPAQLRSKVYIIDEAHQITGAAANAFLKTLEEPPAHTRFILATTDPEELLPTIVSRCQRFDFRRVGADDIVRRLQTVAALEGMSVDADALRLIARHATGSLRDALGLLGTALALGSAISSEESTSRVDHGRRRHRGPWLEQERSR